VVQRIAIFYLSDFYMFLFLLSLFFLFRADSPKVLVSLTSDGSKLAAALNKIIAEHHQGPTNIVSSLKVAQLVLKHRQNPVQHQRIIAFIGSPVENVPEGSVAELVKQLAKQKVAIDFVLFGAEQESNVPLAQTIIDRLNEVSQKQTTDEGSLSHLLTIPLGANMLEVLKQAGNVLGIDGMAMAGDDYFDPEMDPELAMALKLSLEEEHTRQKETTNAAESGTNTTTTNNPETKPSEGNNKGEQDQEMEDEEMLLAKAVAMSMEEEPKKETDHQ
jgi:26S proteasome regulatory subunit N10